MKALKVLSGLKSIESLDRSQQLPLSICWSISTCRESFDTSKILRVLVSSLSRFILKFYPVETSMPSSYHLILFINNTFIHFKVLIGLGKYWKSGSWPRGCGFKPRHRILDGCKQFASYYIKEKLKIKVAKMGTPKKKRKDRDRDRDQDRDQ